MHGFGVFAGRRHGLKMPGLIFTAEHFITQPVSMSAGTLAALDGVADGMDFGVYSTWGVSTSPFGPFTETIEVTESCTVYVRADQPYPLTLPVEVTIT